jgi:methylglutaconyl-CoA hydratase
VRILTLDRRERRNALDTALHRDLLLALDAADQDRKVHAIVLAGHGSVFCSGGDIKEFDGVPDARERLVERARLLTRLLSLFPVMSTPVVAAVSGAALGAGAALVLACDLAVAGDDLKLGFPEINNGTVPAVVMTQAVRHLGQKQAFRMLTQGSLLDASEAQRYGLVAGIVTPQKALDAAVDVASVWAKRDRRALGETKRLFYRIADLPLEAGLQAGLEATAATWRPRR